MKARMQNASTHAAGMISITAPAVPSEFIVVDNSIIATEQRLISVHTSV